MNEVNQKYKELFSLLKSCGRIEEIWLKVLEMLERKGAEDAALTLIVLYFSFLGEGSIAMIMEKESLKKKWRDKWKGIVAEAHGALTDQDNSILMDFDEDGTFITSSLINSLKFAISGPLSGLFVVEVVDGKEWLFAKKYKKAKDTIENRISSLFVSSGKESNLYDTSSEEITSRGLDENLIITGGPGTGKTYSICTLLLSLLRQDEYKDYILYLAAPSGKAADRMRESISKNIETIAKNAKVNASGIEVESIERAKEKIKAADSSTIHRLLGFDPKTRGFKYTEANQYPESSIFVIDECSMIDILLFRDFLNAVPDKARIFLLGDKDQLPSVEAGAVLGEILSSKKESVCTLTKSHRFTEGSGLYEFALSLQKEDNSFRETIQNEENSRKIGVYKSSFIQEDTEKTYDVPVFLIDDKKPLENVVSEWYSIFFKSINDALSSRDYYDLWDKTLDSKILTAERKGRRGLEDINNMVKSLFSEGKQKHYPGEMLMITKNLPYLGLFNGDNGIVVEDNTSYSTLLLMLKKSEEQTVFPGFFKDGFSFYPLDILSEEYMEPAFAITIHKSQGSEYNNVLVILPDNENHPLLNRQILYTAVTRTKERVWIYSSTECISKAKEREIHRDTLICFE